jgi:hypothetical protein
MDIGDYPIGYLYRNFRFSSQQPDTTHPSSDFSAYFLSLAGCGSSILNAARRYRSGKRFRFPPLRAVAQVVCGCAR